MSSFFWSLKEECEKSFEDILAKAGVEPGPATSVLASTEAGKIRRLLAECRTLYEKDTAVWASSTAIIPASKPGSIFGLDLGVKLDADELRPTPAPLGRVRVLLPERATRVRQPTSQAAHPIGVCALRGLHKFRL